jgi:RNA polymerase sigma factor (sigma-70 family)
MAEIQNTDERLLTEVRSSGVEAFRQLFEKYQPALFRHLLTRLGGDADLAHDIVQETFVRVWEGRAKLRPHLALFPYLNKIGSNLARDHFKRSAVRMKHAGAAGDALAPPGTGPEELLDGRALESEILGIINTQLGERCRMIFLLSRMDGKTNAEIAETLGLSRKTVENQITHALKVLRRGLGRRSR